MCINKGNSNEMEGGSDHTEGQPLLKGSRVAVVSLAGR